MDQATVILCYELSGQEALTLHQVKAHVVRAFAASKAFQLGVSSEQFFSRPLEITHHLHTVFFEGCGLGWFRAPSIGPSSGCTADRQLALN